MAELSEGDKYLLDQIRRGDGGGGRAGGAPPRAGDAPPRGWSARRDEQAAIDRTTLSSALRAFIDRLKESGNLRDLRVIEMLFYGQLRNKDVAKIAGIDEKHV